MKLRVHGRWNPGEPLTIHDRPGPDGIRDAYTDAYQSLVTFFGAPPTEGHPVEVVEVPDREAAPSEVEELREALWDAHMDTSDDYYGQDGCWIATRIGNAGKPYPPEWVTLTADCCKHCKVHAEGLGVKG